MSERINLGKIIKGKDRKQRCPRCFTPMRYRKVVGIMEDWSPSTHAWFCPVCPVIRHDGTIKHDEESWCKRLKDEETRRISMYLNSIFSKDKKK